MSDYKSMDEFSKALAVVQKQIPARLLITVRDESETLSQRIKTRVSRTGKDMNDEYFSTYSRSHKYKKKKYGNGLYGQETGFKNYFYQGKMWESFGVKQTTLIKDETIKANINFEGGKRGKYPITHNELNKKHSIDENKGSEKDYGIAYPTQKEEERFVEQIELAVYEILGNLL
jgi:hypothetical protein